MATLCGEKFLTIYIRLCFANWCFQSFVSWPVFCYDCASFRLYTETDRQTDRQTDRRTDGHSRIDRRTDGHSWTDRQTFTFAFASLSVSASTAIARCISGGRRTFLLKLNEPVREKTNNLGSDQVRHKPACTSTEDG